MTTSPRTLQFLESCADHLALNTTYNDAPQEVGLHGMFFHIQASDHPLTIETLELDVRMDLASDWSVEVYSFNGLYNLLINKPLSWDLVAATKLVPSPDRSGAALIPSHEFTEVYVEPNKDHSFYIVMKGPWIDHRSDETMRVGQRDRFNSDMNVFVGAGTGATKFPEDVIDGDWPLFAGTIFYRASATCENSIVTTMLEYDFLVRGLVTSELLAAASSSVLAVVDDKLRGVEYLKQLRRMNSLARSESVVSEEVSYPYQCPPGWNQCSLLRSSLLFGHSESLDRGSFLHEMYRYAEEVTTLLKSSIVSSEIAYVGYRDAASTFQMQLSGVSSELDLEQQIFFANTTAEFLKSRLEDQETRILNVILDSQEAARRTLRHSDRRLDDGSLVVRGRILGAQLAYLDEAAFVGAVQETLLVSFYPMDIIYKSMRPGPIAERDRFATFQGLTSVSGGFSLFDPDSLSTAPTSMPTAAQVSVENGGIVDDVVDATQGVDTIVWVLIGVGAVFVALGCFILYSCCFDDTCLPTSFRRKRKDALESAPSDIKSGTRDSKSDREKQVRTESTHSHASSMESTPRNIRRFDNKSVSTRSFASAHSFESDDSFAVDRSPKQSASSVEVSTSRRPRTDDLERVSRHTTRGGRRASPYHANALEKHSVASEREVSVEETGRVRFPERQRFTPPGRGGSQHSSSASEHSRTFAAGSSHSMRNALVPREPQSRSTHVRSSSSHVRPPPRSLDSLLDGPRPRGTGPRSVQSYHVPRGYSRPDPRNTREFEDLPRRMPPRRVQSFDGTTRPNVQGRDIFESRVQPPPRGGRRPPPPNQADLSNFLDRQVPAPQRGPRSVQSYQPPRRMNSYGERPREYEDVRSGMNSASYHGGRQPPGRTRSFDGTPSRNVPPSQSLRSTYHG